MGIKPNTAGSMEFLVPDAKDLPQRMILAEERTAA